MTTQEIKPCPFCGHVLEPDNYIDSIHPSGLIWIDIEEGRMYVSSKSRHEFGNLYPKGSCWVIVCLEIEGGCGAEMHGDSREEVISKWERRD